MDIKINRLKLRQMNIFYKGKESSNIRGIILGSKTYYGFENYLEVLMTIRDS
jgi:hypothetical protein